MTADVDIKEKEDAFVEDASAVGGAEDDNEEVLVLIPDTVFSLSAKPELSVVELLSPPSTGREVSTGYNHRW